MTGLPANLPETPDGAQGTATRDAAVQPHPSRVRVMRTADLKFITGILTCATGEVLLGLGREYAIGTILEKRMTHESEPGRGVRRIGESILNFKILRKVHVNTVRSRTRLRIPALPRQHWYEVHAD